MREIIQNYWLAIVLMTPVMLGSLPLFYYKKFVSGIIVGTTGFFFLFYLIIFYSLTSQKPKYSLETLWPDSHFEYWRGVNRYSTDTKVFKLENTFFRIPANRTDVFSFEYHKHLRTDELLGGFNIIGVWPDFAPLALENFHLTEVGQQSKEIRVEVGRACRLPYPKESRPPDRRVCNPSKNIQISYNSARAPFASADQFPEIEVPTIPDMTFVGFERGTPLKKGGTDLAADIYKHRDKKGNLEYMVCGRLEDVPNPQCKLVFIWRKLFFIKISFAMPLRQQWWEIKQKSTAYLESIIVPAPPSPVSTNTDRQ